MKKYVSLVLPILFVAVLVTFSVTATLNSQKFESFAFEPTMIPPSMTLLAGGSRWAARNGNSTLFINWRDNYVAHGNTDGVDWGPWPEEIDMENWTVSIAYMLNQTGLDVDFAGDMPENLTGYDLLVIHAYWAVEPKHVDMVRDFIANGGGVVILAGVPEYFRCYCRDWWTYVFPTDNASLNMKEYFGCDGNYVNTGGYANVTVDNPFGSSLMSGDSLIDGAGQSNAAIYEPEEGSQIIAMWERGVAFAYTYEYGQGRVYYQAAFVALDPPARAPGDLNDDSRVGLADLVILAKAYGSKLGDAKWNSYADINIDGAVGLSDLVVLAQHYGES